MAGSTDNVVSTHKFIMHSRMFALDLVHVGKVNWELSSVVVPVHRKEIRRHSRYS